MSSADYGLAAHMRRVATRTSKMALQKTGHHGQKSDLQLRGEECETSHS